MKTVIDIGTRTVIGISFDIVSNKIDILASSIFEYDSRYLSDGIVEDIEGATRTVKKAVDDLEKKTGAQIKEVTIAFAGRHLKTKEIISEIKLEEELEINDKHINALSSAAFDDCVKKGAEQNLICTSTLAVEYYAGDIKTSKIKGHTAQTIKVKTLASYLPDEILAGKIKVMENLGIKVENITLEPVAAFNLVLKDEFKSLNVFLIDTGAGTTDISVRYASGGINYYSFDFAGDELTEETARLSLSSFQTAEEIKKGLKAGADIEYTDILGKRKTISPSGLKEGLRSFLKSNFKKLKERAEIKTQPELVFLIGGGCLTDGYKEIISEIFNVGADRIIVPDLNSLNVFLKRIDLNEPYYITPAAICRAVADKTVFKLYDYKLNGVKKLYLSLSGKITLNELIAHTGLLKAASKKIDLSGKEEDLFNLDIKVNSAETADYAAQITPLDKIEIVSSDETKTVFDYAVEKGFCFKIEHKGNIYFVPAVDTKTINEKTLLSSVETLKIKEKESLKNILDFIRFDYSPRQSAIKYKGTDYSFDWKKYRFFMDEKELNLNDDITLNKTVKIVFNPYLDVKISEITGASLSSAENFSVTLNGEKITYNASDFKVLNNGRAASLDSFCLADSEIEVKGLLPEKLFVADLISYMKITEDLKYKKINIAVNGSPANFLQSVYNGDKVDIIIEK